MFVFRSFGIKRFFSLPILAFLMNSVLVGSVGLGLIPYTGNPGCEWQETPDGPALVGRIGPHWVWWNGFHWVRWNDRKVPCWNRSEWVWVPPEFYIEYIRASSGQGPATMVGGCGEAGVETNGTPPTSLLQSRTDIDPPARVEKEAAVKNTRDHQIAKRNKKPKIGFAPESSKTIDPKKRFGDGVAMRDWNYYTLIDELNNIKDGTEYENFDLRGFVHLPPVDIEPKKGFHPGAKEFEMFLAHKLWNLGSVEHLFLRIVFSRHEFHGEKHMQYDHHGIHRALHRLARKSLRSFTLGDECKGSDMGIVADEKDKDPNFLHMVRNEDICYPPSVEGRESPDKYEFGEFSQKLKALIPFAPGSDIPDLQKRVFTGERHWTYENLVERLRNIPKGAEYRLFDLRGVVHLPPVQIAGRGFDQNRQMIDEFSKFLYRALLDKLVSVERLHLRIVFLHSDPERNIYEWEHMRYDDWRLRNVLKNLANPRKCLEELTLGDDKNVVNKEKRWLQIVRADSVEASKMLSDELWNLDQNMLSRNTVGNFQESLEHAKKTLNGIYERLLTRNDIVEKK